jgi:glycosyltransferase involved in cell wall biosynthesis
VTRPVLLTVSGVIPADLQEAIENGRRPRADYVELARAFDADLLDYAEARRTAGRFGRLIAKVAGDNTLLAWSCFRRRKGYQVVFTDGEQVGLPLAALSLLVRRRPRHVMIGHRLSAGKKVVLHRLLRLRARIDRVIVYASTQQRVAIETLRYPGDRVVLMPFMVDTRFFQSDRADATDRARPLVCAVGQELRDYPTLIEAVRDLDVDVIVAAASPWSKRADSSAGVDVPPNVVVDAYNLFGLRQLYADASVVVVPLQETDFQAGITTILEAMAMGKAVVCTRTTGQVDTIIDGSNGVYVPPGDVAALRAAIVGLVDDPARATALGTAGRQWVAEHADIDVYVAKLAAIVRIWARNVLSNGTERAQIVD